MCDVLEGRTIEERSWLKVTFRRGAIVLILHAQQLTTPQDNVLHVTIG